MLLARNTLRFSIPFLCISSIAACQSAITLAPRESFTLALDAVDTITATVTGVESGVTYTSSNPAVAVVHPSTGEIWGRSAGIATITATATAAPRVSATVQVTVGTTAVPMGPLVVRGPEHKAMMANLINQVCPNEEEAFFADSLPIDADLRVIHEFHDCQRLIEDNGYGPLVGIFAHRNVTSYPSPMQYIGGRLAAIIVNFKTKTNWLPYAPLGLATGTNCLVLRFTPSFASNPTVRPLPITRGQKISLRTPSATPGTWQAAVVHRPSTTASYGDCSDKMDWDSVTLAPAGQKQMLDAIPQPDAYEPDGTGLISPPVARWDWDRTKGNNYMGVRCGIRGWCEIGKTGFTPLPALTAPNSKNIYKGYYDQQYLAASDGTLSDVWGTVRPGEDAIVPGLMQRQDNKWWDAARIELEGPLQGSTAFSWYTGKLFMTVVADQAAQVRRGQAILTMHSPAAAVGKDWDVKVNGVVPGGGPKMTYRGHKSEAYDRFGTVRWRWNEDDETVWSFCEEAGCCEVGRW
jgi:hypothetical protein